VRLTSLEPNCRFNSDALKMA